VAAYYLETSALIKRYRSEKGTEVVDEVFEGKAGYDVLYNNLVFHSAGGGLALPQKACKVQRFMLPRIGYCYEIVFQ